jgi:hypothetical protein
MFQPLKEQIETAEGGRTMMREHFVRFTGVAAISAVIFGGLLVIILALE